MASLFPTPVPQYDNWVLREALHNCVAHQDYVLGGKINVVENTRIGWCSVIWGSSYRRAWRGCWSTSRRQSTIATSGL